MPHIGSIDSQSTENIHYNELSQEELITLANNDLDQLVEEEKWKVLKEQFTELANLKQHIEESWNNSAERKTFQTSFDTVKNNIHATLSDEFLSFHADEHGVLYVKDPDGSQEWSFSPLNMSKDELITVSKDFDEMLEEKLWVDDAELYDYQLLDNDIQKETDELKGDIEQTNKGKDDINNGENEKGLFDSVKLFIGWAIWWVKDIFTWSEKALNELDTDAMPDGLKKKIFNVKAFWKTFISGMKSLLWPLIAVAAGFGLQSAKELAEMWWINMKSNLDYPDWEKTFIAEAALITPENIAEKKDDILAWVMTDSFYKEHKKDVLWAFDISPMAESDQKSMDNILASGFSKDDFQAKATWYLDSTQRLALQVSNATWVDAKLLQADYLISHFYLNHGGQSPVAATGFPSLTATWDENRKWPTKNINGVHYRYFPWTELGRLAAWIMLAKNHYTSIDELIAARYPALLSPKYKAEYEELKQILMQEEDENPA